MRSRSTITAAQLECARADGTYLLDLLLNEGHRLTAYAADDAHFRIDDGFGGWMMVKAEANEPDALLSAMKAGDFYSSQGPLIHAFAVEGGEAHVDCSPAVNVAVVGRGSRAVNVAGRQMTRASLPLERFAGDWFRLVVTDAAGRVAWSNPVWLGWTSARSIAVAGEVGAHLLRADELLRLPAGGARAFDIGKAVVEEQGRRRVEAEGLLVVPVDGKLRLHQPDIGRHRDAAEVVEERIHHPRLGEGVGGEIGQRRHVVALVQQRIADCQRIRIDGAAASPPSARGRRGSSLRARDIARSARPPPRARSARGPARCSIRA